MKRILFLMLGLLPAVASAVGPGPAALDFLEKARSGDLDLGSGGDTALQADATTAGKLQTIRKGIERLGADLGKGELEIGEVKEDDGYAAVIVRKVAGFDSSDIRVYPVALVKRGGQWFPAPVLASFENAVSGYTLPVRERLSALESWMMMTRVTDLKALISRSADSTRELIRKSSFRGDQEGDDLAGIAKAFQEACAAGDRAAILGFLGGLSDPLPEDWPARLAVSRLAIEGRGPWRLLTAPEVVRVPVLVERADGRGMVSIACLDPSIGGTGGRSGMIRIIHIDFEKDAAGRWRMDLPSALMTAEGSLMDADEGLDDDLLNLFPKRLREEDPVIAAPTARAALDGVMESLKSASLRDLLRRADLGKDGMTACSAAARIWWSLNEPGAMRMPVELGFEERDGSAAGVFHWFSVNDPDRFEPITFHFRKSPGGWIWIPEAVGESEDNALADWVRENEPGWRLSWRGKLMKPGEALDRIGFTRIATEAEVSGLMADWMGALGRKDLVRALSLSALLGGEAEIPMKALRNLSHDLANFREGEWSAEGIHRSASWAAASIRQTSGGKVRTAFIPVVVTATGPRFLPEIDLFAEDSRTRGYLNESSFGRLEKFADKERVAELRELFRNFQEKVKKSE